MRAKIRIIRKFPPSAQTTGNGTACTAEGCTMTFPPRRPKRPETKAHARQEHASGQNSRPDSRNNQKRKHMHCRSTHQDKVPAPTAQTTRNESTCTAEAHITTKLPPPPAQTTRNESARTAEVRIRTKFPPRRPKRPETKAHALQKRTSAQNSRPDGPNDQKRKHMHGRSVHQEKIVYINPFKKNKLFMEKQ